MSRLALFLTCAASLPPGDDPAAKDLKALQGTWVMVNLEVNGKDVPLNKLDGTVLSIKGDQYIVNVKDKTVTTCKIVIDPNQDPKHFDMIFLDGEKKDKAHKGIYRLEGDKLQLARGLNADQERPNQFATWPDTNYFVVTWKRQ